MFVAENINRFSPLSKVGRTYFHAIFGNSFLMGRIPSSHCVHRCIMEFFFHDATKMSKDKKGS